MRTCTSPSLWRRNLGQSHPRANLKYPKSDHSCVGPILTKLLTNGLDLDSSSGTWTDVAHAQVRFRATGPWLARMQSRPPGRHGSATQSSPIVSDPVSPLVGSSQMSMGESRPRGVGSGDGGVSFTKHGEHLDGELLHAPVTFRPVHVCGSPAAGCCDPGACLRPGRFRTARSAVAPPKASGAARLPTSAPCSSLLAFDHPTSCNVPPTSAGGINPERRTPVDNLSTEGPIAGRAFVQADRRPRNPVFRGDILGIDCHSCRRHSCALPKPAKCRFLSPSAELTPCRRRKTDCEPGSSSSREDTR
jgi:hypothetical protein